MHQCVNFPNPSKITTKSDTIHSDNGQGTDYNNIIYYTSYYFYNDDAYIQTTSSNKI